MVRQPGPQHRVAVASSQMVAPEILYYMVDDPRPAVCGCVAVNPATPTQADGKLANDEDDATVRAALAHKIALRAPGLMQKDSHVHTAQTMALLEKLARDQLPMVRWVVTEVLKNESRISAHIVQALTRDIALVVVAPVLGVLAAAGRRGSGRDSRRAADLPPLHELLVCAGRTCRRVRRSASPASSPMGCSICWWCARIPILHHRRAMRRGARPYRV